VTELEGYAAPVRDAGGAIIAAVIAAFDTTERNEARRILAQSNADLEARVAKEVAAREAAQELAAHTQRMHALGQLTGGIAHDFNNILQAVDGAAALIERQPFDGAVIRRLAQRLRAMVDRGASITRRLLAFGRHSDLRADAIDMVSLPRGMQEVFEHTLGTAIAVEVRSTDDLPSILADKGTLETALVNLATNARDAMSSGGRLVLAADAENVGGDGTVAPLGLAPGRYVRLTVSDTGAGMDAATLAHATDPFFTTKAPHAGTGLGLPMVRGFAEQSGGALNIASQPHEGTTVTLWLPVAPAREAAPAAAAATDAVADVGSEAATAARVLLVDDEDLLREVLAEQLEDAGSSVLVASSGPEALALLAAGETVDALVTDLSMPGMDGLALIRAAQKTRPDLPAVLLTGYVGEDSVLAPNRDDGLSFALLRKPVRMRDLVERLQSLLAGQREARTSKGRSGGATR
jgi:signal transduction histidine kinase/ActR/RegA family two-component response regulator